MCRLCKKLREINDLREKNLEDCIKKWRNRDFIARKIIEGLIDYINKDCPKEEADIVFSAIGYLSANWVGD